MKDIILDEPLTWNEIVAIAEKGARLTLSLAARQRIMRANSLVEAIVASGIRAYGVNTGVGALSDVIVRRAEQNALSLNILMSHAVGVGAPMPETQVRAIMAAAVNNFAHGFSGLRLCVVERLIVMLDAGCTPVVRGQGSVGYLAHMAQISLTLAGHGKVDFQNARMPTAGALAILGLAPLELQAKEGLSLVNGSPCATGLACIAVDAAGKLLDWADAVAAMSFETQRCQLGAVSSVATGARVSQGQATVVANLSAWLEGSAILAAAQGRKTQDALSLRAIPQVHGAARDVLAAAEAFVRNELASVSDNPFVAGSVEAPEVHSQANAVAAGLGLAMDSLAIAMAQIGAISERRIDRMVNPLVSGLPAFLAEDSGVASGFMIAQYTAVSLSVENRRLAAPAALDGGVTSGLQEDILCHATQSSGKLLSILDNLRLLIAIEFLTAAQSYDLLGHEYVAAPGTQALYRSLRAISSTYRDDRPLGDDIAAIAALIGSCSAEDARAGGRAD